MCFTPDLPKPPAPLPIPKITDPNIAINKANTRKTQLAKAGRGSTNLTAGKDTDDGTIVKKTLLGG